jgi:capsular exopolysaccharide synthesis family protein
MSLLEKAVLKGLKSDNKKADDVKGQDGVDSILSSDVQDSPVIPKKKETSELVSSRTRISKMSQSDLYSAKELADRQLISANMKDTLLLDQYRNLRTKLLAVSEKSNFITLVTSVVPDDSSCLVAANLAATFALDGAKTATLIEANVQNPILDSVFDMKGEKGLIDYLEAEDNNCDQILHKSRVKRLRFVPSGLVRENSAEYFTSNKMKEFIDELVSRYPDRFPIINAPSIINSADARILAEMCDLVILVVPYGKCTEEEINHASFAIGEKKLSGIVLNQF